MKPKHIDRQIADYYAAKKLPRETFERLEAAAAELSGGSRKKGASFFDRLASIFKIPFERPAAAIIGTLCVVVLAQVIFFTVRPDRPPKSMPYSLEKAVIRELSMNHYKNLQVEFNTPAIESLSQTMAKLDFAPVTPKSVKLENYIMKGARYCSIQGNLAVLITLQHDSGSRHSLYQAPLDRTLAQIHRQSKSLDGITVNLWREGSIFMGLVGPVAAE